MEAIGYKAVILGSTGAIGRELVAELCASSKWSEIAIIARRELDQWKNLKGYEKLKLLKVDDLDSLQDLKKWNFTGFHSMFCCLGSRTKEGEAVFTKVDYTYPLYGGQLAKEYQIKQYSIVSSMGADHTSMFLYPRTKGKIENALKALNFPIYSIFRPGVLLNRDNDARAIEKFMAYVPFVPKIDSKQVALALRIEAEQKLEASEVTKTFLYENKQILQIIKDQQQSQQQKK